MSCYYLLLVCFTIAVQFTEPKVCNDEVSLKIDGHVDQDPYKPMCGDKDTYLECC